MVLTTADRPCLLPSQGLLTWDFMNIMLLPVSHHLLPREENLPAKKKKNSRGGMFTKVEVI